MVNGADDSSGNTTTTVATIDVGAEGQDSAGQKSLATGGNEDVVFVRESPVEDSMEMDFDLMEMDFDLTNTIPER